MSNRVDLRTDERERDRVRILQRRGETEVIEAADLRSPNLERIVVRRRQEETLLIVGNRRRIIADGVEEPRIVRGCCSKIRRFTGVDEADGVLLPADHVIRRAAGVNLEPSGIARKLD